MRNNPDLKWLRTSLVAFVFSVVSLLAGAPATAQTDYPSRPVKIVVPYPAGGTTDVVTRIFAEELTRKLGQPFVVDNRPGGGTNVGAEFVARSAPDGYVLFVVQAASHGVNPSLFKNLSYNALKDFTSAGQMARTAMFLVANTGAPFNSVRELVTYARANPGKISFASQGNGSPGHLAGALFMMRTNTNMVHIPYKGAAQALNDLAAGQVQLGFLSLDSVARGLAKEGKLKVLGVAAASRWPIEPQIPSAAEEGVPNFEALSFFGLSAPANTPEVVLEKLNKALVEIAQRPDISKRIMATGLVPLSMTRAEMTSFIETQVELWKPVVQATGAKVE